QFRRDVVSVKFAPVGWVQQVIERNVKLVCLGFHRFLGRKHATYRGLDDLGRRTLPEGEAVIPAKSHGLTSVPRSKAVVSGVTKYNWHRPDLKSSIRYGSTPPDSRQKNAKGQLVPIINGNPAAIR